MTTSWQRAGWDPAWRAVSCPWAEWPRPSWSSPSAGSSSETPSCTHHIRACICKRLRSPGIDSAREGIFKLLRNPWIDSKESVPPDDVAWRGRYDNPIPTRFPASIDCSIIRAQFSSITVWSRNCFIRLRLRGAANQNCSSGCGPGPG